MKLRERRSVAFLLSNVFHNVCRLAFVVLVIWYELGTYYASLSSCNWPILTSGSEKPSHVLLLSDTQVIHTPYTFFGGLTLAWRRFLSDLNLRKNWHVASRLRPHAVVFLGDMLASGSAIKTADEYDHAVQYFKSIFAFPDTPLYYVPGNSDISLGKASRHAKELKNFYIQSFGPLNQVFSVRNHTFVGLDAPGLVDEDYQRAAQGRDYGDWNALPGSAVSFVRSVYTDDEEPRILLSHIPLSRPSTASCGPLREKGRMHRNVGDGFQSLLGKQTTQFLLDTLRPSLIFSGDNRDYCEFTHTFAASEDDEMKQKTVREVTVKSFSMSKHIRRPGFQLLSLVDPSSNSTSFADSPCLLPDQERIYSTVYPALLVMMLLALFIYNKTKLGRRRKNQLTPLSVLSAPNSGHQTPVHYADSDAWSTRTTNTFLSPRNSTQSFSPLSVSNGAKLRTLSCPVTPDGSPPHRYLPHLGESDEEEAMYPVYSPHQFPDHELRNNEVWSSRHEDDRAQDDLSDANAQWASTPGWKPVTTSKPLWSWTFVFRERRRRVTLNVPTWDDLNTLCQVCQGHVSHARRKGIIANTIIDFGSVLWPALLTWTFITWCHF